MKINCSIYFDDESSKYFIENSSTGEVIELGSIKKTTTRKKKEEKVDDDPVAKITLLDSKYCLNTAAVTLMGVEPDNKLEIRYEKTGFTETPNIGKNTAFGTEAGNRLTKSYSVSFKGKQRERLLEFGDVFEILEHPTKKGIFILKGNKEFTPELPEEVAKEIELPEDVPFDLDELDDEETVTEVSSSDFDFSC